MNGFLLFNGATIPSDSDELGKRIDEIEIRRRGEHAPEALSRLNAATKKMRPAIVDLQLEILRDPEDSRKRFVEEYDRAQSEIANWENVGGRDARHIGHAALSLAAARLVDHKFPIAIQVETALRRRFGKSENVSRFQRTSAFLDFSYQTLSGRSSDRKGAVHLLTVKNRDVEERYLCLALGTLISQVRAAFGSRWNNPVKEAHIYENLGLGKIENPNTWVVRIRRDHNRKEALPLRNKEVVVLVLDNPGFPDELRSGAEDIASLCANDFEETASARQAFPWGDFAKLVEGGEDVG